MKGPLENEKRLIRPSSGKLGTNENLSSSSATASNSTSSIASTTTTTTTSSSSSNSSSSTMASANLNEIRERNAQILEEFLDRTGELIDSKLKDLKILFVESIARINQSETRVKEGQRRFPLTRLNKFTRYKQQQQQQQKEEIIPQTSTSVTSVANSMVTSSSLSQQPHESSSSSSLSTHQQQNNPIQTETNVSTSKRKKSPDTPCKKQQENGRSEENLSQKRLKSESSTIESSSSTSIDDGGLISNLLSRIEAELSIETLQESETSMGVVLTWDLVIGDNGETKLASEFDKFAQIIDNIKEYQIYGCQGTSNVCLTANADKWILIGVVESHTPPIKCTLTDFLKGCTYHFSIRIKFADDTLGKHSNPQKVKL